MDYNVTPSYPAAIGSSSSPTYPIHLRPSNPLATDPNRLFFFPLSSTYQTFVQTIAEVFLSSTPANPRHAAECSRIQSAHCLERGKRHEIFDDATWKTAVKMAKEREYRHKFAFANATRRNPLEVTFDICPENNGESSKTYIKSEPAPEGNTDTPLKPSAPIPQSDPDHVGAFLDHIFKELERRSSSLQDKEPDVVSVTPDSGQQCQHRDHHRRQYVNTTEPANKEEHENAHPTPSATQLPAQSQRKNKHPHQDPFKGNTNALHEYSSPHLNSQHMLSGERKVSYDKPYFSPTTNRSGIILHDSNKPVYTAPHSDPRASDDIESLDSGLGNTNSRSSEPRDFQDDSNYHNGPAKRPFQKTYSRARNEFPYTVQTYMTPRTNNGIRQCWFHIYFTEKGSMQYTDIVKRSPQYPQSPSLSRGEHGTEPERLTEKDAEEDIVIKEEREDTPMPQITPILDVKRSRYVFSLAIRWPPEKHWENFNPPGEGSYSRYPSPLRVRFRRSFNENPPKIEFIFVVRLGPAPPGTDTESDPANEAHIGFMAASSTVRFWEHFPTAEVGIQFWSDFTNSGGRGGNWKFNVAKLGKKGRLGEIFAGLERAAGLSHGVFSSGRAGCLVRFVATSPDDLGQALLSWGAQRTRIDFVGLEK